MSNTMNTAANTIAAHEQILHFPKGQKPSLAPNEWLIWGGNLDKSGLRSEEHTSELQSH